MKAKGIISALMLSAVTLGSANAALIPVTSITDSGSFTNSTSLLTDGAVPAEGTGWDTATIVYWNGTSTYFTFDFGSVFTLQDTLVSVDNNDDYAVTVSSDGVNWSLLYQINAGFGNIPVYPGGMDTMSSDDTDPVDIYVSGIDFAPTNARYARIAAVGGDNSYSIGELAFYGEAYVQQPPGEVSAPNALVLLLSGLGLIAARRRKA